jgi:hypothetical protein
MPEPDQYFFRRVQLEQVGLFTGQYGRGCPFFLVPEEEFPEYAIIAGLFSKGRCGAQVLKLPISEVG